MIATCFALAGFAASAVTGLVAGNTTPTVLWRSTLVMLAAYVVGRIVGSIAQRTVEDHIRRYKEQHPIPEDAASTPSGSSGHDRPGKPATAGP